MSATELANPDCQVKDQKDGVAGFSLLTPERPLWSSLGLSLGVICYHSITYPILTDAAILLITAADSGVHIQKHILQSCKLRLSFLWLVAWTEKRVQHARLLILGWLIHPSKPLFMCLKESG